MMNRIVIVIAIIVFVASAGAALWIQGQMSTLQSLRQRKPGVLSLEIEADTRDHALPFALKACGRPEATAVLSLDACSAIRSPAGTPYTIASPSGEVSMSVVDGIASIRISKGAEQSVRCPPASAPKQPVWRFCVERKSAAAETRS